MIRPHPGSWPGFCGQNCSCSVAPSGGTERRWLKWHYVCLCSVSEAPPPARGAHATPAPTCFDVTRRRRNLGGWGRGQGAEREGVRGDHRPAQPRWPARMVTAQRALGGGGDRTRSGRTRGGGGNGHHVGGSAPHRDDRLLVLRHEPPGPQGRSPLPPAFHRG